MRYLQFYWRTVWYISHPLELETSPSWVLYSGKPVDNLNAFIGADVMHYEPLLLASLLRFMGDRRVVVSNGAIREVFIVSVRRSTRVVEERGGLSYCDSRDGAHKQIFAVHGRLHASAVST